MKHGPMVLALMGGLAASAFAADVSAGWQELTPPELSSITGGDLMLSVNRDLQMMTVTRITPGNYDNIQCFTVKVTTSVVRNKDITPTNPKTAMENTERKLASPDGTLAYPKQFPTGTAKLSPTPGPSPLVEGLSIRSNATQLVTSFKQSGLPNGPKPDSGYNVHYVDPAKSTNTFGCVGVQSQSGMNRVLDAQRVDNSTYKDLSQAKQTITVSAYSEPAPAPKVERPKTNLKISL